MAASCLLLMPGIRRVCAQCAFTACIAKASPSRGLKSGLGPISGCGTGCNQPTRHATIIIQAYFLLSCPRTVLSDDRAQIWRQMAMARWSTQLQAPNAVQADPKHTITNKAETTRFNHSDCWVTMVDKRSCGLFWLVLRVHLPPARAALSSQL